MKKIFLGTLLLALAIVSPITTTARAEISVRISLPPPIMFSAPPQMIVLPETYVYVVPDVDMDIFFWNGWWWRPWEGRWYRSRHYNSGWVYYRRVPSFYGQIPPSWRNDYRDRRWRGSQWDYQRIPHQKVQRNWKGWERNRYWEKQQTWGVQNLQPRRQQPQPSREMQPRQSQPQMREVQPRQPQPQPQSQPREIQPQRLQPQSKEVVKPQHQEVDKPQHQKKAGPQPREVNPEHSKQPQGGHEKGEEGKKNKK